jgi:hypothetical protein
VTIIINNILEVPNSPFDSTECSERLRRMPVRAGLKSNHVPLIVQFVPVSLAGLALSPKWRCMCESARSYQSNILVDLPTRATPYGACVGF